MVLDIHFVLIYISERWLKGKMAIMMHSQLPQLKRNFFKMQRSEVMVEPLTNALNDEKREVRILAAELLGNQQDERAIEALKQAENDQSNYVRMAAKRALKTIQTHLEEKESQGPF